MQRHVGHHRTGLDGAPGGTGCGHCKLDRALAITGDHGCAEAERPAVGSRDRRRAGRRQREHWRLVERGAEAVGRARVDHCDPAGDHGRVLRAADLGPCANQWIPCIRRRRAPEEREVTGRVGERQREELEGARWPLFGSDEAALDPTVDCAGRCGQHCVGGYHDGALARRVDGHDPGRALLAAILRRRCVRGQEPNGLGSALDHHPVRGGRRALEAD